MREVGGLKAKMPVTSLCVRVGALSIAGVPPFNGFFSKLIIIIAVIWSGHLVLGALFAVVSVVTLVTFIKVQRYLLEGEVPERLAGLRESPMPMLLAMGLLAVLCVVLGVLVPAYRFGLLDPAAQALQSGLGYAESVLRTGAEYAMSALGG